METNVQKEQNQKSLLMRVALIVLGILLITAIVIMAVSLKRGGRLKSENAELQTEKNFFVDESQRLQTEKNKGLVEINGLKAEIVALQADFDEKLRNRDAQISTLRSRSVQAEQLRKQIEEFKVMEADYKELQGKYELLMADNSGLETQIKNLSGEIEIMKENIERSKGLQVYNISPLTKWERWFWADRYNVNRARRVDETAISLEIAGNDFSQIGNRTVYLNMIDPQGSVMYPSAATFLNKETGNESPYTQMKQINFTGDYIPLNFLIKHPNRLDPGIYKIKVFIDGEPVRTGEIAFE